MDALVRLVPTCGTTYYIPACIESLWYSLFTCLHRIMMVSQKSPSPSSLRHGLNRNARTSKRTGWIFKKIKTKLTGEMSDMDRAVGTEMTIAIIICTINVGHVTAYTGEILHPGSPIRSVRVFCNPTCNPTCSSTNHCCLFSKLLVSAGRSTCRICCINPIRARSTYGLCLA